MTWDQYMHEARQELRMYSMVWINEVSRALLGRHEAFFAFREGTGVCF